MKTSLKSKIAIVVVIAGLSFSCKTKDTTPVDENTTYETDSTATTIDSTQAPVDTTTVDTTKTVTP